MSKHAMARQAILDKLSKVQWNSFRALRGLFTDRAFYPRVQTVSDSTMRRVINELVNEGIIQAKWKCSYPVFFLAYSLVGKEGQDNGQETQAI